ncbi:hypothetical protein PR048_011919 [Dryococelus australis]|uniref:Uncharacterized protein n=1 Tax=Dryococelus australis TaxID=614101 RepID=A0ABQ9HMW1_9NEOP|nr:hypothetical protein PR048_011919 [Dryococelus australis]
MGVIEVSMEKRQNKRVGKREIPEKTRRPTALSCTIPTCESPVTRPGIEPGSHGWETSRLTAQPTRPLTRIIRSRIGCSRGLAVEDPNHGDLVLIPGGVLADFQMWETWRAFPINGDFSQGIHFSLALQFCKLLHSKSFSPFHLSAGRRPPTIARCVIVLRTAETPCNVTWNRRNRAATRAPPPGASPVTVTASLVSGQHRARGGSECEALVDFASESRLSKACYNRDIDRVPKRSAAELPDSPTSSNTRLAKNPPTNGIVRHDSHTRKPGYPAGDLTRIAWMGGEQANRSATSAPVSGYSLLNDISAIVMTVAFVRFSSVKDDTTASSVVADASLLFYSSYVRYGHFHDDKQLAGPGNHDIWGGIEHGFFHGDDFVYDETEVGIFSKSCHGRRHERTTCGLTDPPVPDDRSNIQIFEQVFTLPIRIHGEHEDIFQESRHGSLFPNTMRCIIAGPSSCGNTCVLLSLLEENKGLRFEHVYLYSKSVQQPKYQLLARVLQAVEGLGYFPCSDYKDAVLPSEALPNSIFIFDDFACEKQTHIQEYFSMGRHSCVDCVYLRQTFSRIPKQMLRDNANVLVLFRMDNMNLQDAYDDQVNMDMTKLVIEGEAGSEVDHKESIDDDYDGSDNVEVYGDSPDVPTYFHNEFPSTSDVKKAEDAANTDYTFTEDLNKLVDRLEYLLYIHKQGDFSNMKETLRWSGAGMQGRGKREVPRENPPASGIVQHDSHMRVSGSEPTGYRARIAVVGGERSSYCAAAAPTLQ